MKVLFINAVCGVGSTGRIITDLCDVLKKSGHQVKVAYGVGTAMRIDEQDTIRMNNKVGYYSHNIAAKLTDKTGLYSSRQTRYLIEEIKKFAPDLIHLHNLHGYYINYKLLFEFLAGYGKPIVWTLHDCWAFTGHCAHFTAVGCDGWKNECRDKCPFPLTYPRCYLGSRASQNYQLKKKLFSAISNMTIVTPSQWLSDLVNQTFLHVFPIKVINNGIDLAVFRPINSTFKKDHGFQNKKMILAVSNVWNTAKGYNDAIQVAQRLNDRYQMVMVGLTQEQMQSIPSEICAIQRTNSVEELAAIYSAADVSINLTYEDNFPTVNLESLACGTPVVTYRTGGSVEAADASCGLIVDVGDIDGICHAVDEAVSLNRADALSRAQRFSKQEKYNDYLVLYHHLLKQE